MISKPGKNNKKTQQAKVIDILLARKISNKNQIKIVRKSFNLKI